MRFTINRRALNKALTVVQRCLLKTSVNNTYTFILLNLDSKGLSLTASSAGLMTIKHTIPHVVNNEIVISNVEEGAILIKGDLLLELVRKLDGMSFVTLEVFDDTIVKIESESFSATINGTDAAEYPDMNLDEDGEFLSLDARKFVAVVDQTCFAASTKDKPPLNAINFSIEGGVLDVTATDTTKLARKTISVSTNAKFAFNVAAKTADSIARMAEDADILRIYVNKNRALFVFDNTKVFTQLVAADYPNTKSIRLQNATYRLEANTQLLITALERVSALSATQDRAVKLTLRKNDVKVSTRDENNNSAIEKLAGIYYESEPLEVSCGFLNLATSLKALRCEDVVLEFTGEMRPFRVSNPHDDSISILITPVRLI